MKDEKDRGLLTFILLTSAFNHHVRPSSTHPRSHDCRRLSRLGITGRRPHGPAEAGGHRQLLREGLWDVVREKAARSDESEGCVRAGRKFEEEARRHLTPQKESLYSPARFGR
jgi:hypothetical protein